jgi:LmbE family N-acetylglucosaminyl deacetylase
MMRHGPVSLTVLIAKRVGEAWGLRRAGLSALTRSPVGTSGFATFRALAGLVGLTTMTLVTAAEQATPNPSTPASVAPASLAPSPPDSSAAAILHDLRNLTTTARVLHIGAHPDDENTQLITYLSRGRGYDIAYLSITRGDGGQNLLGPDFDEKLGVARTQELLAARRIDGGRQFFTRAIDFGFSKTSEETLSIWNHQAVLSDVVRVIRRFQPDVIVTRFPIPPGSGGHGHHTASAILAVEAFKAAGDPNAFPEQLKEGLAPWQAKRILWNRSGFSRGGGIENNPTIKVDIGGRDPVTAEPFGVIAARSRAMHKTQDMGGSRSQDTGAARLEGFVLLGGEEPTKDLMDGTDPTWGRFAGGTEIGSAIDAIIAHFNSQRPDASVPALLAVRRAMMRLPSGVIAEEKLARLDRVIEQCLGLHFDSQSSDATVVPGESKSATASVSVSSNTPVQWVSVAYPEGRLPIGTPLNPKTATSKSFTYTIAKGAPITRPYWLRAPGSDGLYHVDDPRLIGLPENGPAVPVTYTFQIEDQSFTVVDGLRAKDAAVVITPPVALRFDRGAAVFRPTTTKAIRVEVIARESGVAGTLRLEVPSGWRVSPPQSFKLDRALTSTHLAFQITAPAAASGGVVAARASVNGAEWTTDTFTVEYAHIPPQLLQPKAERKIVSVDVATRGQSIGYIAGAGDDIPEALLQLGYNVTELTEPDLTLEHLNGYDAVVVGVRAFNTRKDLAANMPALLAYVENGGTLVCQYNRTNLLTTDVAPYHLKLSDLRTTDENAPVTFLAPDHPVLNSPNKITPADFGGWVQERGTYYPSEWDSHFVPILAMADPGESPLKGALLVAPYGKGWYVYAGVAFFRQLPAGVPGAYRLFANLVSLGK